MKFHFIYVEDNGEHAEKMRKAVKAHNTRKIAKETVTLQITSAADVGELRRSLEQKNDIDMVLADVYYKLGSSVEVDRLQEIIDAVKARSDLSPNRPSIPVIAYTSHGEQALHECLKHKEELFDIWDKDSASWSYATWRLSRFALELSRLRPDTFLQRAIGQMPGGASWHTLVTEMPDSYNIGQTEFGQIESIGSKIESIAGLLHMADTAKDMWEGMTRWEHLSRGVSRGTRGHARHVVNVFWIGYYLAHHKCLTEWFESTWIRVLRQREDELEKAVRAGNNEDNFQERLKSLKHLVETSSALESFSDAWFVAGLFHDVAACVPKYRELRKVGDELIERFGCRAEPLKDDWIDSSFGIEAEYLFNEMEGQLSESIRPLWLSSLSAREPDHGVVAAIYLKRSIRDTHQIANVFEAARAVAVHNLIGGIKINRQSLLSWERDPLTCLLLLCDQIQTWDRERDDENLFGPDAPTSAQLTALDVKVVSGRVKVEMSVEYIVPRHLQHSKEIYARIKAQLERVIREKPTRALARIAPEWPFDLEVICSLSGQELSSRICLGSI